ncbi:MAG TPA: methionyl-tRNA formyltransferase [Candidatus Limnocylindrales bacterium]
MTETAAEPSTVTAADGSAAVRAVFFGSGSFAVPILDALAEVTGVRVEAVVSAPDRPVGRKAIVTPTPVVARARELGLPVLQPVRVRRPEFVEVLRALEPELIVLADYGQLIPRVLLDLPARGFLNLHPSALPRHRGAAPIPASILAGDTESAVTLIVVTEEMDAGPIVASEPLAVRPDDTAVTLEARAADVAAVLLRRALPEWLAGRLEARPQPTEGVTMTRPLRREDGRLDPGRSAVELERQVRAYQPWPGAYLETGEGRLIVWKACAAPSDSGDVAGRLVAAGRDGLALAAAAGRLFLVEVQISGKKRVSAGELRRGYPGLVGAAAG